MVCETALSPSDFILPMFLHEDAVDTPIASMPGVTRWSLDSLVREAGEAHALGIPAVVLFPKIEDALKSPNAAEAANDRGLVPRAIRALKAAHPTLCVITDVALDPYNSDGHDGIVRRNALRRTDHSQRRDGGGAVRAGALPCARRGGHRRAIGHDGRPRGGDPGRAGSTRISPMSRF